MKNRDENIKKKYICYNHKYKYESQTHTVHFSGTTKVFIVKMNLMLHRNMN